MVVGNDREPDRSVFQPFSGPNQRRTEKYEQVEQPTLVGETTTAWWQGGTIEG